MQKEISDRDAGWRAGLEKLTGESAVRFQSVTEAHLARMESLAASVAEASRTGVEDSLQAARAHLEKNSEALLQGLGSARESLQAMSAEASDRLRGSAEQAETWLQSLARAAEKMREAAQDSHRAGEENSATQSGFRTAVETLNQGLGGMLDRLQSFALLAQGQEALLAKMEATVRRFEERSVELLEDNALKIQESFLDALERIEGGALSSAEGSRTDA